MLATFVLIGTLLTMPVQDTAKVNFAHNFTKGQNLNFDLNFKGNAGGNDMEINASFALLFGEKSDKGTSVTISPKSIKMNAGGQEMDQGTGSGDTKYVLDEHGMPDSVSMQGESGILVIPLVLSYLPNKELAVGDTFDIDWKQDKTTFKGTGKYEGLEKVNEKSMSKITVKAKLDPDGQGEGSLDYTAYFDKESGHVNLVKGKASVQDQEFNFTLTKK